MALAAAWSAVLRYALRRLIAAPFVLLILITLSFVIMHAPPGDPFQSERAIDPAVRAGLEQRYGLDQPYLVQWYQYVRRLLPHQRPAVPAVTNANMGQPLLGFEAIDHQSLPATLSITFREPGQHKDSSAEITVTGASKRPDSTDQTDLNISNTVPAPQLSLMITQLTHNQQPVTQLTIERPFVTAITINGIPHQRWIWCDMGPSIHRPGETVIGIIGRYIGPSLRLGVLALLLATLIGVTAGTLGAIRRNSLLDYSTTAGAMLGLSVPTFVIGPLLILLFELQLGWVHVPPEQTYLDGWRIALPALTLALPFAARISRLSRAGLLEIVNQDFVRSARAKGIGEWRIVTVHVLRGGLLPVVGFIGPAVAAILTGSLVVEKIFQIPGLGRDFVESALQRDYFVVLGTVVLYGGLVIIANVLSDLLAAVLDPRVRYD